MAKNKQNQRTKKKSDIKTKRSDIHTQAHTPPPPLLAPLQNINLTANEPCYITDQVVLCKLKNRKDKAHRMMWTACEAV